MWCRVGSVPGSTLTNGYDETERGEKERVSSTIRVHIGIIHGFTPNGYWQCDRKKMTREDERAQEKPKKR